MTENLSTDRRRPFHGGRLQAAVARFGIARERWLDLSTGINPQGWPVPALPAEVFSRLPEADDGLVEAAETYYGSGDLLPVPGSQAAIERLPWLRLCLHGSSRVSVLEPGYAEHSYHWRSAEHQVSGVAADAVDAVLDETDVLVVINPGNPDAVRFEPARLREWHRRLQARGGWLVVDEAFLDATPAFSLILRQMPTGLIVLRSLGKFFGLAGLRVGFTFAAPELLKALEVEIDPWSISHPSRYLAAQALRDHAWQQRTRESLPWERKRLERLVQSCVPGEVHSTELFAWVQTPAAAEIWKGCARQGVLLRLFEQPSSLRIGLPADETQWQRLEKALARAQR